MSDPTLRLVIIDGNAIIHRAYHAIPPLTTREGLMVNAVYGFVSMLFRVLDELRPTHLAVSFDLSGPTFRHEAYKDYKATRVKADQELYNQIPLVKEITRVLGISIFEKQGYEADDVIGTIAKIVTTDYRLQTTARTKKAVDRSPSAVDRTIEIYIVTGDMDTLQLVDEHTKVYTLRKGLSDTIVYDPATVKDRYGFGPELVVDYKALRGDPSDNIPGVPGIGEKTATELIQKVGGVDVIYKQIESLKDLKIKESVINKLRAGEESALMSRQLATIDRAVPELGFKLKDCELKSFDREKILPLFQRFEFLSLLKRLPGAREAENKLRLQRSPVRAGKIKKIAPAGDFTFSEIKTAENIKEFLQLAAKEKKIACQALVDGVDVFSGRLQGLVLAVGARGFYVSSETPGFGEVLAIFSEPEYELAGHDLKKLIKILMMPGKATVNSALYDVMLASYLLNPGSRAHDAAGIVFKTLGVELTAAAGQAGLFGADQRLLAKELYQVAAAGEVLRQDLQKIDSYGLYQTIEAPLITVLAEMELNGIALDTKKLAELSARAAKDLRQVQKKIYQLAGQEFNVASPLQLREILFDKLNIPAAGIKKGKTGLSTSSEELQKMKGQHPIIPEIENYRELAKLQNTYLDVLPALVNPVTRRVHTTFNQAITATGRLSSSDPNLQNIPARTAFGREIREAFIAEAGNVLVSADYSQIELRIVASLAQDKKMLEIFEQGLDIHSATAAAIHGVPLDKVTKDLRRSAKEINFGILYGMGAYGLAWRADIPQWEAKEFIAKYFRQFAGVKKYIDTTLEFARQAGYCETLFGRRRYIPELNASNFQLRAAGERMAINHPIQGTAADVMKMAMIAVRDKLKAANLGQQARMVLQVHDELVLEVKQNLVNEVKKLLKETMESAVKLRVPVVARVSSGYSWGALN